MLFVARATVKAPASFVDPGIVVEHGAQGRHVSHVGLAPLGGQREPDMAAPALGESPDMDVAGIGQLLGMLAQDRAGNRERIAQW